MTKTSRAPQGPPVEIAEVLALHEESWIPVFLARAGLGLGSVLIATRETPDGAGSVAVVSPAEASAWLKQRGDTKLAAKVSGTAPPGAAWGVGVVATEQSVFPVVIAPRLKK